MKSVDAMEAENCHVDWSNIPQTIGTYYVHPNIAKHIDAQMRRTMTGTDDSAIPAGSPCGKECQRLFTDYATMMGTSKRYAGMTLKEKRAYTRLERAIQVEGYPGTFMFPECREELAEAVCRVAAIYMFG